MGTTEAREACTRRMLLGFAAADGALDERVRELAEGRAYNLQPFRRPLPPYPEIVWTRLTQASQAAVIAAYWEHRDALAGAGRGRDPAAAGCDLDNLRWLLARNGPLTASGGAAHAEASRWHGAPGRPAARHSRAFPTWTSPPPTCCCSASTRASSPTVSTT